MMEDASKARGIVAIISVAALALLCGVLIFYPPPEGSREVLFLVVGALIAFCTDVKQFYFGSSEGSKTLAAAQTETVKTLAAAATSSGTGSGLTSAAPSGTPSDPVAVTPVDPPPTPPEPPPAFARTMPMDPDDDEEGQLAALRRVVGPSVSDERLRLMLKLARGGQ